jgi:hypothetical protein
MLSTSVKAIPLIELDTTNLPLAYEALNDGLPNACFMLNVTNDSDNFIYISYDGIFDHEVAPGADAGFPLRFQLAAQTNSQPKAQEALFERGLVLYVKSATANAGTLAISGYYV